MAIEDGNPERRNLVVLSMAIIAFYVGGCEIPSTGEIELPLIKLKFTDAYHIGWLVWIMLCWFLFRYYVESRKEFVKNLKEELNDVDLISNFQANAILKSHPGYRIGAHIYTENQIRLIFPEFSKVQVNISVIGFSDESSAFYGSVGGQEIRNISVNRNLKSNLLFFISVYLRCFLKKPSISAYLVPYVIFAVAVGFGMVSKIMKPDGSYYWDSQKFLGAPEEQAELELNYKFN